MTTYGFNLGQIEGLDSSVQTVTLTIANQSESNTYTLNKAFEDPLVWSDGPDFQSTTVYIMLTDGVAGLYVVAFTESDVGDTYNVTLSTSAVEENFKSAVETVLVDNGLISEPETLFDGTITITDGPAEIPFDMDVSSYPFEKWTVTINGLEIPYQAGENDFVLEDDNMGYTVFDNDGVYMFNVVSIPDTSYPPVPGDYQVKITGVNGSGGGGSSGLPDVSASDNGSVLGVINGEWGVDDRFKYLPSPGSPSSPDASISGRCLVSSRGEEFIWKQINPIPLAIHVKNEAEIYLPIHYRGVGTTEYVQVRPHGAAQYNNGGSLFLLLNDRKAGEDVNPAFVEITPPNLSFGGSGSYSLRATITRGTGNDSNRYTYSFQWVSDT